MKSAFVKTWKRSIQPRKQRKYNYNAPLHILRKINFTSPLSKELKKKYDRRNLKLRNGDVVKVMRGQFKGKTGAVNKIITKTGKVYIDNIENVKKDGTKSFYPLKASNLLIIEVYTEDKRRFGKNKESKKELKNG